MAAVTGAEAVVGKPHQSLVDAATFGHFAVGFSAGFVGISPTVVVIGLAVWEALDTAAEGRHTKLVRRESPLNHLGDVVAGAVGALAGAYYYGRRPGGTPLGQSREPGGTPWPYGADVARARR